MRNIYFIILIFLLMSATSCFSSPYPYQTKPKPGVDSPVWAQIDYLFPKKVGRVRMTYQGEPQSVSFFDENGELLGWIGMGLVLDNNPPLEKFLGETSEGSGSRDINLGDKPPESYAGWGSSVAYDTGPYMIFYGTDKPHFDMFSKGMERCTKLSSYELNGLNVQSGNLKDGKSRQMATLGDKFYFYIASLGSDSEDSQTFFDHMLKLIDVDKLKELIGMQ